MGCTLEEVSGLGAEYVWHSIELCESALPSR